MFSHLWNWILIATIAVAKTNAVDYGDSLSINSILQNDISPNDNSTGSLDLNYGPAFGVYDLVGFKNYTLVSLSSYDYLKEMEGMLINALENDLLGDAFLLYHKIIFNGQAATTAPTEDSNMAQEMAILLNYSNSGGSTLRFSDLATMSSSNQLSDFYYTLGNNTVLSTLSYNNVYGSSVATTLRKRNSAPNCSSSHQASKGDCGQLIGELKSDGEMFYAFNGNRSIAWGTCFVSVSGNGSWVSSDLFNAAESCYNFCGTISISCEVYNVNLGGYWMDQCISNRPDGCD